MAKSESTAQADVTALAGGRPLTESEILAQIPGARARGAEEQKHGLRAVSARYSVAHEQLYLELRNGTVIGVPVSVVPALRGASPRELTGVEVTPTGSALHWERLDVDLSVPALVREALGAQAIQSLFGAAGGRVTTPRKAEAARANGAKGGRPLGTGAKKSGISKHTQKKASSPRGKWFPMTPEKAAARPTVMKVAAKAAGVPRGAAGKSSSGR